jgi:ribosome maturation factor RimP
MDRQGLITELTAIVEDCVKGLGLELVDIIYRYEGRDVFLRVLVDRPEGGITLGECANVNNELSRLLDEKDIIRERYMLEVSSPGADRPLKGKSDFLRCLNKRARFFFNAPVSGKTELEGLIVSAGDDAVTVNTGVETIEIPLDKINIAKQVLG